MTTATTVNNGTQGAGVTDRATNGRREVLRGRQPLPAGYWKHHFARGAQIPEIQWQIPGLLPLGLTVLMAPPKVGKSFLADQIEDYLTAGLPVFGYSPQVRQNTLAVDLEGNLVRTHTRARLQVPALDPIPDRDTLYVHPTFDGWVVGGDVQLPNYAACRTFEERLAWLDAMLITLANMGKPIGHVRIDTLKAFCGPKPPHANAYEHEAAVGHRLQEIAWRHSISIVVVHHTRKASADDGDWMERVSGSNGITGSADCIWLLDRHRASRDGVLRVLPRDGEEIEAPVRFDRGLWSFADDISPAQARHTGLPRRVLDALAAHPTMTLYELREELDIPRADDKQLRVTLDRLQREGDVEHVAGLWRMIDSPAATDTEPGEVAGQLALDDATEETPDVPAAPAPVGEDPGEVSTPQNGAEGPGEGETAAPEMSVSVTKAIDVLFEGITTSRSYTVPLIAKDRRGELPWSLGDRIRDGHHGWERTDFELGLADVSDFDVVVLDRNGAYPSAMSAVSVASAALTHTGPMSEYDRKRAGIALIDFDASALPTPSPLGTIQPGSWVAMQHVAILDKLGMPYDIEDSWTGRATTKLFEPFYKWTREQRAQANGNWEDVKRSISLAIRSLHWSKPNRIWRPDWHAAVVAEANIRHWIAAQKAIEAHQAVIALNSTDEVALLVPCGVGIFDPEFPLAVAPYELGTNYGQVKVKGRVQLSEWIANGNRLARVDTRRGPVG